jgi:hypothetical protein
MSTYTSYNSYLGNKLCCKTVCEEKCNNQNQDFTSFKLLLFLFLDTLQLEYEWEQVGLVLI